MLRDGELLRSSVPLSLRTVPGDPIQKFLEQLEACSYKIIEYLRLDKALKIIKSNLNLTIEQGPVVDPNHEGPSLAWTLILTHKLPTWLWLSLRQLSAVYPPLNIEVKSPAPPTLPIPSKMLVVLNHSIPAV